MKSLIFLVIFYFFGFMYVGWQFWIAFPLLVFSSYFLMIVGVLMFIFSLAARLSLDANDGYLAVNETAMKLFQDGERRGGFDIQFLYDYPELVKNLKALPDFGFWLLCSIVGWLIFNYFVRVIMDDLKNLFKNTLSSEK